MIAIGDVNIARNQTRADFEISLSYPATEPVTVNYTFGSDTATAGQDFTAGLSPLTGTVTFQPGESWQTISVAIPAGQRSDDTQGFSVTLTDPENGELDPASASATGHIIGNNDHSLDAAAIDFNALDACLR